MPNPLPPEVEASLYELTMLDGGAENTEYLRAHLLAQAKEIERLREGERVWLGNEAAITCLRSDRDRYKKAVEMAQDYINNILGCPSPDFLASAEALEEADHA